MSNYSRHIEDTRRNILSIIDGLQEEIAGINLQITPLEDRKERILKSIGAHRGYLALLDVDRGS